MRIAPVPMQPGAMPVTMPRYAFGVASIDGPLGGGLAWGCVHEVYAGDVGDAAAAAGFVVALVANMTDRERAVLWLRSGRSVRLGGVLQANGWAELGGVPANALVSTVSDRVMLLRAAVEALRCPALGAVVVESWGAMPELDITASRRLTLAAEKSGVPLFLLRCDASPVPSAAQTRWAVGAAPSRALPGSAPGRSTFDITLLRQKSGPCGLSWRLEWDRDQRQFREAQVSGNLASVPARRPTADAGAGLPDASIAA